MPAHPVQIEIAVEVDAPPAAVWPYLVDWEHLDRWMQEGASFQVTTPHREGVGVEARARIRIAGVSTIDAIRVRRWEPPDLLEIEHLGWVKGAGIMRCVPSGSGTRVEWRETLVPPWGLVGAAGIRAWKPLMRRIFLRDLRLLKALVESERPE